MEYTILPTWKGFGRPWSNRT